MPRGGLHRSPRELTLQRHSCLLVHLRPPRFEHAEFVQFKALLGTRLGTYRRDGGRNRREHGEGRRVGHTHGERIFMSFYQRLARETRQGLYAFPESPQGFVCTQI